ncbi:MAG: acetyl-CoA carboxylase biotin carboxylase subunit [Firmicutes bacterium]|nr:acetyl-CoA carboxylase biotin carboxylase subunit [Bacillota bacterium]
MFAKILIANRGEIAVRIIRACKEMGVATVAVFSQADRDALHVSLADESFCIGPAPAGQSYLNQEAILSAALLSGAQAIHPGYGLLSENAVFARRCAQAGLAFIGPDGDTIERMGDKDRARRTMAQAGLPTIPGSDVVENEEEAAAWAEKIGFPLLVKARSGGGGRGIRLVREKKDLAASVLAASAEAQAAFGDGGVYLEKFLAPAKHVELQMIGDSQGHILCLGERECSMQRKNQKVLEESPCAPVSPELRQRLCRQAVTALSEIGYQGLGTMEFLLSDGRFYFMEMNTRLQVEHPVSEMVTGVDLVKWQIRVAAGQPLDFTQADISLRGHAIECRICAENPRRKCGVIELLHVPGGPWVRFDTALYQGYTVPPYYDAMIAKLIVHAPTREEAIRKMQAALCEMVIEGVEHNRELLLDLMADPSFLDGSYDTGTLNRLLHENGVAG